MTQATVHGTHFKSPLHEMTQTTPTCLWNDSASTRELTYSIDNGAVGATCNPVIVLSRPARGDGPLGTRARAADRGQPHRHRRPDRLDAGRGDIQERRGPAAARSSTPQAGRNGRLSIQTDPRLFRDTEAIVAQAVRFSRLAPNMIVKIPATSAGIPAIEEATYLGVSINATVSFTLPQCVAVAEAVERGLERREREGKETASISPVCTIMVGRLDDWLKVVLDKQDISTDPGYLEWAGVAVFKKTYALFVERGYRDPPALGRFPQPHALERADRRGRGRLAPVLVAGAFQRQRHPRGPPHRQARRAPGGRGPDQAVRRLPAGLHRGRPLGGRVRHLRAHPADVAPVHRRHRRAGRHGPGRPGP